MQLRGGYTIALRCIHPRKTDAAKSTDGIDKLELSSVFLVPNTHPRTDTPPETTDGMLYRLDSSSGGGREWPDWRDKGCKLH